MGTVAAIAEVLAWIGLVTAAFFAIAAAMLRLARGPWESAPAVRVDGEVRWMAADGSIISAQTEQDHPTSDDDLTVYYRTRRPDECHFEKVAHDERSYRFVALILVAVGVLGFIISTVASLL